MWFLLAIILHCKTDIFENLRLNHACWPEGYDITERCSNASSIFVSVLAIQHSSWIRQCCILTAIAKCQRYVNVYRYIYILKGTWQDNIPCKAWMLASPADCFVSIFEHNNSGFGSVFGCRFLKGFIQNNIACQIGVTLGSCLYHLIIHSIHILKIQRFKPATPFSPMFRVFHGFDGRCAWMMVLDIRFEPSTWKFSVILCPALHGFEWKVPCRAHVWQGWCMVGKVLKDENFESIQIWFVDWPICIWLYLCHMYIIWNCSCAYFFLNTPPENKWYPEKGAFPSSSCSC